MPEIVRKHVMLAGRVQGIGFRWFAYDEARHFAIAGWIRNVGGDRVELEAQGSPAGVDEFISRLKTEHPMARVWRAEEYEVPPVPEDRDFQIDA